jgi:Signal transduction histidine kinase
MRNHLILLTLLLLFAACSRFADKNEDRSPQTAFAPDTLFTPTGNTQLDSLLQLASVAPQDTSLAKLYYKIGGMFVYNDTEKAKDYYAKLKKLNESLNWPVGHMLYAVGIGSILIGSGLNDSALVILQQALELAKRENIDSWVISMLYNVGNVYYTKEWYETALTYFMETIPICERNNLNNRLQFTYYSMSLVYTELKNTAKAIEYGEKTVAINNEDEFNLCALAVAYSAAKQYEKSNFYLQEALRFGTLHNNLSLMGNIYFYSAKNAILNYNFEDAETYLQFAIEKKLLYNNVIDCEYMMLGGQLEMMKGNYNKAEEQVKEALQIAIERNKPKVVCECYRLLAELATARHKYHEMIQYREQFDLAEQEMAKEKALRASEEMAARYETEKKQLEIERQQEVITRQNMQRSLLAGGILISMVILGLLWYMLRLRSRRNHVLAEMNATKDKFFSIISHDLKNPAVSQRDAIKLLVKNDRLWDADTLSEYYAGLLNSADGQVELLYNLLNWAKIQTGRMTYTPAVFGLTAQLRSDLVLIQNMAENKGITLNISIPEDALITGDINMLITVLRNLLTNAVKFTASGGTVTLSVEPSGGGKYAFIVSDTGVGMSEEQICKLFRLDSTHFDRGTAGEQGSGLGLIVCKELIEKHGNRLRVESEKGKGSRFWFEV